MALIHAFSSSIADGGDATLVRPSNWNADHRISGTDDTATFSGSIIYTSASIMHVAPSATITNEGFLNIGLTSSYPSSPASGFTLAASPRFGMAHAPVFMTPDGGDWAFAKAFWQVIPFYWKSLQGTSTQHIMGVAALTTTGTIANTAATVGGPIATTLIRNTAATPAAASNGAGWFSAAGTTAVKPVYVGTAGSGSFFFSITFSIVSASSQNTVCVGFLSGIAAIAGNASPAAQLNSIYVGAEAADTNLKIYSNDGTSTATAQKDLGVNFPKNTAINLSYQFNVFCKPAGNLEWSIKRLDLEQYDNGVISTDIPVATALLGPHVWIGNGTGATISTIALHQIYGEAYYPG